MSILALLRGAVLTVITVGITAGLAAALPAEGAVVARTRTQYLSADQAGYAVTGARFWEIEVWARLPDPWQFARQLGWVDLSVQLWNNDTVATLSLSACTDATCRPDGRPAHERYHFDLSIFNARTRALICSTSAPGRKRCPHVPRDWQTATVRGGQMTSLVLSYNRTYGGLDAQTMSNGPIYSVSYPSAGKRFTQERVVAQFGPTPWTAAPFRAPGRAMHVMWIGVPPPPPDMGEIGAYSPTPRQGCVGNWPWHHKVVMPGKDRAHAFPSQTWQGGCDFNVTLQP